MKAFAKLGLFLFVAVPFTALAVWSCSSSSPSSPTSATVPISQGKGLVRGTVTDGEGNEIVGAKIYIDGEEKGVTDESGVFTIEVDPGSHTIKIEIEGGPTVVYTITVEEGETVDLDEPGDPGEPGDTSNGIGQCVSECTSIYNPSNRPVDPDAIDIMNGKFNARPCVELCRDTGYRGGASKDADGRCNPFYSTTTDAADCGNLKLGDSCTSDDECAGDLLCIEGACAVEPECTSNADCAEGQECIEGSCAEPPLSGFDGPCNTDRDCEIGLLCNGEVCVQCTSDDDCAEGQECTEGVCAE